MAFLKDFSVEGPTTKRDLREKRKSGEVFPFGGSGVLSKKIFVFLSSLDLISCNFSMIFAHFQTKRDITIGRGGGAKPFSGGEQHRGWGGGGALAPPVYMLKKALNSSCLHMPTAKETHLKVSN